MLVGLFVIGLNCCWSQLEPMPPCPQIGNHVFAIPGRCDQFVRCTQGWRTHSVCSSGVFDNVLGTCNSVEGANKNCRLQAQCSELFSFRDQFFEQVIANGSSVSSDAIN